MGSLFSKKASSSSENQNQTNQRANRAQVSDKDRAILDLKNARDKLKKYRKKLDLESARYEEQAKQLIKQQQRQRALLVLKLRRHRDAEATKVDGQLITVLDMINTVEWESQNMDVLRALQEGTKALNKMHEELSIEDVANLLDETREAIEVRLLFN